MSDADDDTVQLPLFPLSSVVLPGGLLPLRLFEPRYLDMVSDCMKQDSGFGVCLIREGAEAGEAALPYGTGTEVSIVDWDRQPDGLLGITVRGERKIQVHEMEVQANQLIVAEASPLLPEPAEPVPDECQMLVEILRQSLNQLDALIHYDDPQWDDASWVGSRLTELLPLPPRVRQYLVELDNPTARLHELRHALK